MSRYDTQFYESQMAGSARSANVVVPLVMDLVGPRSVVDIGCGVGTWLAAYKNAGVERILGIDGNYVDRSLLLIDEENFLPMDLSCPIELEERFDLVQTLEVAEHIDPDSASTFVDNLVRLGEVILFSAAIPYQLGTDHINEQFFDYWANLFAQRGYQPLDCVRPGIWDNQDVNVWYRQNTFLFAKGDYAKTLPKQAALSISSGSTIRTVVHPELYMERISALLKVLADLSRRFSAKGDIAEAEGLFQLLLHYDPRNAEIWDAYGQLAARLSQLPLALEHFDKAISLNSESAGFVFNRALVHVAMGHSDQARTDLRRALELDPDFEPARARLDSL